MFFCNVNGSLNLCLNIKTKLEQKVRRGQLGKARSAHIKKGRRNAGDDHYSD